MIPRDCISGDVHDKIPASLITELDLDGKIDGAVMYIGKAKLMPDNRWICLASIGETLAVVEIIVTFSLTPCR